MVGRAGAHAALHQFMEECEQRGRYALPVVLQVGQPQPPSRPTVRQFVRRISPDRLRPAWMGELKERSLRQQDSVGSKPQTLSLSAPPAKPVCV
jgi:hypothetical protein